MNLPLAHPTHWVAGLLYLAPVIVLAFAILWQRLNRQIDADVADPSDEAASPGTDTDRPPPDR